MPGFHATEFFHDFDEKAKAIFPDCDIGHTGRREREQFPYMDASVSDNPGSGYDLENNEVSNSPLITVTVYCDGAAAYDTCMAISMAARELILSYGFLSKSGPSRIETENRGICCLESKYQRVFGSGDLL